MIWRGYFTIYRYMYIYMYICVYIFLYIPAPSPATPARGPQIAVGAPVVRRVRVLCVCVCVCACVWVRWDSCQSACGASSASIRQHTSAYVSIRQHTLAQRRWCVTTAHSFAHSLANPAVPTAVNLARFKHMSAHALKKKEREILERKKETLEPCNADCC